MSDEANNVAILTEAYRRWHDTRGGSADHWMSICAEQMKFGSLAQGAPHAAYLTAYQRRDELGQYFAGLIPLPTDQNRYAQSRKPMEIMRHGWSTSLFQASQQWSTTSS